MSSKLPINRYTVRYVTRRCTLKRTFAMGALVFAASFAACLVGGGIAQARCTVDSQVRLTPNGQNEVHIVVTGDCKPYAESLRRRHFVVRDPDPVDCGSGPTVFRAGVPFCQ